MKTRNQIKKEEEEMTKEFTHQFFDDASKAWLANKVKYGQDMYRYKRAAFQEPIVVRKSKRLLLKKENETKTT